MLEDLLLYDERALGRASQGAEAAENLGPLRATALQDEEHADAAVPHEVRSIGRERSFKLEIGRQKRERGHGLNARERSDQPNREILRKVVEICRLRSQRTGQGFG
ncbi:MAG: hypothetical protein NVS2B9_01760 [Myxococcales bacterium]